MNIWLVIIVIIIISVILSVFSLKDIEDKSHVSQAKKKLFKGRTIFHDSSSRK